MSRHRRRFVPPLGWPPRLRVIKARAARFPGPVWFNRYPRQIIGVAIRLPRDSGAGDPYVSVLWAQPARWWSS